MIGKTSAAPADVSRRGLARSVAAKADGLVTAVAGRRAERSGIEPEDVIFCRMAIGRAHDSCSRQRPGRAHPRSPGSFTGRPRPRGALRLLRHSRPDQDLCGANSVRTAEVTGTEPCVYACPCGPGLFGFGNLVMPHHPYREGKDTVHRTFSANPPVSWAVRRPPPYRRCLRETTVIAPPYTEPCATDEAVNSAVNASRMGEG